MGTLVFVVLTHSSGNTNRGSITDNFCFYLQNRLIQTSQTGGQWYCDTSPFSIPCIHRLTLIVICQINIRSIVIWLMNILGQMSFGRLTFGPANSSVPFNIFC